MENGTDKKKRSEEIDRNEGSKKKQRKTYFSKPVNSGKDVGFLPLGKKILEGRERRRKEEKKVSCVHEFLKYSYSNGIVIKMMRLMGYEGGGLGINQQGILNPIDVNMPPKNQRLVIGSHKEPICPAPVEKLSGQPREKLWSKQAAKKKMQVYKTIKEFLAEKQEQGFEVIQKVLDMNAEDVPMPELQHNVKLLVYLAELDVLKIDKDLSNEMEAVAALQKENEKLEKEATQQKQHLENMQVIMNALDQIKDGTLTLEWLANSFMDLQTRVDDYYNTLSWIALPLFIGVFQGWDPLQSPTRTVEVVSIWKKLLGDSLYTQLLIEVVVPAVRTNSWDARDPEPMLRFLESWEDLLPPVVLEVILDTVVMPKISAAVDNWDPCKDTIPIHSWIHPWLPLLGHKLEENCYETICLKLSGVLDAWHPSDMSAYCLLSPWKAVFKPVKWDNLMVRYIFPKLVRVMHELAINPSNQNLDPFYWVRTWVTVIPTPHMMHLMDIFFNKWQQVLYHWLCLKPNFEEVAKWYRGWKELLPPKLHSNMHVRRRLNDALEMMDMAVQDKEVGPPIGYLRTQKKEEAAQHNSSGGVSGGDETMSLKDVIEIHALSNGLDFKLKPGRKQDGHQIYAFGNISIIADSINQKVFAFTQERRWSLVSLDQLLDLHNRKKQHL